MAKTRIVSWSRSTDLLVPSRSKDKLHKLSQRVRRQGTSSYLTITGTL